MALGLEKAIFGNISAGVVDPIGNDYTAVGRYFHDMHLWSHYTPGGNNEYFHPIAACIRAIMMGIAFSIFGNMISGVVPPKFRMQVRIGLEGGPWVYAASIIYTAAQGWSAATKGDGSGGRPTYDKCS